MQTVVSVFGVEPRRIGGTEMFARELSAHLGESGWQSVVCFTAAPQGDVRRFLELPNVTLETLPNSTDAGWRACFDLFRILRKHRPQILHLHFVSFLTLYPWLGKLAGVTKIFFTDHHSRPAGHVARRAPWWKRIAARLIGFPYTKIVCVSNYGYDCMTAVDALPRARFEIIYNGIARSRVTSDRTAAPRFRERFSISPERQIVGQMSWLIPEKGIDDFLEVAQRVTAELANVQFVWVGDGSQRERYVRAAAAKGLSNHVTFTGMIDDPLGEGVFQAFDVVCQFSRWEEVFGWMIAEAMAHGRPVVATRVGGIPELITDGTSGYLVDRSDVEGMTKRVIELLNNPDLRAQMGQLARGIVAAKFDLTTNVAQLIESYDLTSSASERFGLVNRPHLHSGTMDVSKP
ncbi:MAG TPA: glycosyltransferase family 4 protein [Pyrinomonadaceae bacterium]|jgi:glycosyltransferase involved in cell wall biosynthesis|nr:glycosyltransferase family 4 protein [Pyrinomonadaceae bacterium]